MLILVFADKFFFSLLFQMKSNVYFTHFCFFVLTVPNSIRCIKIADVVELYLGFRNSVEGKKEKEM